MSADELDVIARKHEALRNELTESGERHCVDLLDAQDVEVLGALDGHLLRVLAGVGRDPALALSASHHAVHVGFSLATAADAAKAAARSYSDGLWPGRLHTNVAFASECAFEGSTILALCAPLFSSAALPCDGHCPGASAPESPPGYAR